jgi:hypothetical protein
MWLDTPRKKKAQEQLFKDHASTRSTKEGTQRW